jgi:hypothetical protein
MGRGLRLGVIFTRDAEARVRAGPPPSAERLALAERFGLNPSFNPKLTCSHFPDRTATFGTLNRSMGSTGRV